MKKHLTIVALIFFAFTFFANSNSLLNLPCVRYTKEYLGVGRVFNVQFTFNNGKLVAIKINNLKGEGMIIKGDFLRVVEASDIPNINLRKSDVDDGVYELFVVLKNKKTNKDGGVVKMLSWEFDDEKHISSTEQSAIEGRVVYKKFSLSKSRNCCEID